MAYISFSAEGDRLSAFRDALRSTSLPCMAQQMRGGVFYAKTGAKNSRRLSELAGEYDIRLTVLERHGLRFLLHPYRFRFGLLCGLVCGCFFLYWCNATVRRIEIHGNETVSDTEILKALADLGVERGVVLSEIPYTYIEQRMRLRISDIEWIALRGRGGLLTVELTEEQKQPEMLETNIPCNIVAAVPAQVTGINVLGGHAAVQKGDPVKAGQILISGVKADKRGISRYYHADGTVTGIYTAEFTQEQPFVAELPVCGKTVTGTALELFGERFTLSPLPELPAGDRPLLYEEHAEPLTLLGHDLPFRRIDCHCTLPQTAVCVFSEEETVALLEESAARFERNFHADDKIISRDAEFSRTNLGISLKINYVFEGVIGKSSEIFVKLP